MRVSGCSFFRFLGLRQKRTKVILLCIFVITTLVIMKIANQEKGDKLITGRLHRRKWLWPRTPGNDFQACVLPEVPLWTKESEAYIERVEPIICNDESDWVFTENGKFYIKDEAIQNHGEIKCDLSPIVNVNDTMIYWKPIRNTKSGAALSSDAFIVECQAEDGYKYKNVHPCIRKVENEVKFNYNASDRFNILIYGFDSLSRNMFKRLLPYTHSYFTTNLGGQLLEGYNIVGDGTTQALLPMLTGLSETEMPEVRRGKRGAVPVDSSATFLWKRYEKKGYVTQWGEDMAWVGTFQYRLLGFKDQPVNHYMRAFQKYIPYIFKYHKDFCLGSRPRHKVFIDWLKEGLMTNKQRNFFTFGFFSEYSHDNNNPVIHTDKDNVEFMEFLKENGFLVNTIVILMSDHGIRYGDIRHTEIGKLEERMPYFGVYFPDEFKKLHPQKLKAFETNIKRLSTPFDIHETLIEILDENEARNREKEGEFKGRTLFKELPKTRSCDDAGIDTHWCSCMQWDSIDITDKEVIAAANAVIQAINSQLEPYKELCQSISLDKIDKSILFENNNNVLKFKKTVDMDGRVADLSDTLAPKESVYQITFSTLPRKAKYEATVKRLLTNGQFVVNTKHISRLNKYGDAPKCIADKQPELRPYCVCVNTTSSRINSFKYN